MGTPYLQTPAELDGQVLTQEFEDDKGKKKQHLICYVSGQFRGSQQNWAALTKEAYAIYMAIRKLSFYITDAEVTIKCDHLPLKKFLQKQTLNAKVNNWAVELEQFNLKLEWIQGVKNTLADSLSRLLDVDPEANYRPRRRATSLACFALKVSMKLVRSRRISGHHSRIP